MDDHGKQTPHIIGNQGEAPFDAEPGIIDRIRQCSSDLDEAIHTNAARTQYSTDPGEIDRVSQCLDEIADELFKWCRDRGEWM